MKSSWWTLNTTFVYARILTLWPFVGRIFLLKHISVLVSGIWWKFWGIVHNNVHAYCQFCIRTNIKNALCLVKNMILFLSGIISVMFCRDFIERLHWQFMHAKCKVWFCTNIWIMILYRTTFPFSFIWNLISVVVGGFNWNFVGMCKIMSS